MRIPLAGYRPSCQISAPASQRLWQPGMDSAMYAAIDPYMNLYICLVPGGAGNAMKRPDAAASSGLAGGRTAPRLCAAS